MASILSNGHSPKPATPAVPLPPRRPLPHSWLMALLLLRCPRCRQGCIFEGPFAMNPSCPVCRLLFQREAGYFLGAMYCSYAIGTAFLVPIFYLLQWLFPTWPGLLLASMAMLPYILLTPAIFRYSRALWIYMDRYADPGETSHSRR